MYAIYVEVTDSSVFLREEIQLLGRKGIHVSELAV